MKSNIEKHFEVTKSIIDNSFMHSGLRGDVLLQVKKDSSTIKCFLNCVGSFCWSKTMTNEFSMFVVFPIFFDLLDTYIDKRFGCVNSSFAGKVGIIKNKINPSIKEDHFLLNLYEFCVSIRNCMIHHSISYNEDIIEYKGNKISIDKFRMINEAIYQYVKFGLKNKSLYERNSLFSCLLTLLGKNSDFAKEMLSLQDFVYISHDIPRYKKNIFKEIENEESYIFDYVAEPINLMRYSDGFEELSKRHPDPNEKIIYAGEYYLFDIKSVYYLVPCELINNNRKLKFCDISEWKYSI